VAVTPASRSVTAGRCSHSPNYDLKAASASSCEPSIAAAGPRIVAK
jgi:hypothetical protein